MSLIASISFVFPFNVLSLAAQAAEWLQHGVFQKMFRRQFRNRKRAGFCMTFGVDFWAPAIELGLIFLFVLAGERLSRNQVWSSFA
jgi:hypothetical protein